MKPYIFNIYIDYTKVQTVSGELIYDVPYGLQYSFDVKYILGIGGVYPFNFKELNSDRYFFSDWFSFANRINPVKVSGIKISKNLNYLRFYFKQSFNTNSYLLFIGLIS
jgi:hypothetical protein